MAVRAIAVAAISVLAISSASGGELERMERPPVDWSGRVFTPSLNYPAAPPAPETLPWAGTEFAKKPRLYMEQVLAYVLEGQDKTAWRVQDNSVRPWYHAAWMGPGASGREFINGLTRERSSRPFELGPGQTKCRQNWAVSFYNAAGGYAFGAFWRPVQTDAGEPDLTAVPFPVGTVSAKLLFTEATAEEVPLLTGAPEVSANIHLDPMPNDDQCAPALIGTAPDQKPARRAPAKLRLLQLDVAVRDSRASARTGWVFGTFVFDGRKFGADPWEKLEPVGLMWGNDEQLTDFASATGRRPSESIVLSDFGLGRAFGRGGRMNGPVDNPVSSCLSCHSTAQWPRRAEVVPPSREERWEAVSCWFRNLSPATPFGGAPPRDACGSHEAGTVGKSLDYSLQLAIGRANWQTAHDEQAIAASALPVDEKKAAINALWMRAINPTAVNGVTNMPITRGESAAVP